MHIQTNETADALMVYNRLFKKLPFDKRYNLVIKNALERIRKYKHEVLRTQRFVVHVHSYRPLDSITDIF